MYNILNTYKSGASLMLYCIPFEKIMYRDIVNKSPILSEIAEWHGRKGRASQAAARLMPSSYHEKHNHLNSVGVSIY